MFLSWATVFFALPSCNRFPDDTLTRKQKTNVKLLKFVSILQSYAVIAFVLSLLITAPSFGSTPECNKNAVAVIFRPFRALPAGRIACCIVIGIIAPVYTFITAKDYVPAYLKEKLQRKVQKIIIMRPVVKENPPDPRPTTVIGSLGGFFETHQHSKPVERPMSVVSHLPVVLQ